MNSWKFNSISQYLLRDAITKYFKLEPSSIYRAVKTIEGTNIIMYNNKVYEFTLKEIKNGTSNATL